MLSYSSSFLYSSALDEMKGAPLCPSAIYVNDSFCTNLTSKRLEKSVCRNEILITSSIPGCFRGPSCQGLCRCIRTITSSKHHASTDRLYNHILSVKNHTRVMELCRMSEPILSSCEFHGLRSSKSRSSNLQL